MSTLKHMSVSELKREILSCENYRDDQIRQALIWEDHAAELIEHAKDARRRYHNVGQRVVWARKYLAEKELNHGRENA